MAAAGRLNVPPLDRYFAVPAPGIGVEPSVVYQMPVLPCGPAPDVYPGSVRVTVSGKDWAPAAGDMLGMAEPLAETVELQVLPVCDGGVE